MEKKLKSILFFITSIFFGLSLLSISISSETYYDSNNLENEYIYDDSDNTYVGDNLNLVDTQKDDLVKKAQENRDKCGDGFVMRVDGTCMESKNKLAEHGVPDQLFDITFTIDQFKISSIKELSGVATYASFGGVPTPVDYEISLFNEAGEIITKYPGYIVVETENVEVMDFEKFDNLDLPYGKYRVMYTSVYNVDVHDEFIQDFTIGPLDTKSTDWTTIILIFGVIILLVGGLIFFFK